MTPRPWDRECTCGHTVGEHRSSGAPGPLRSSSAGVCKRCDCQQFTPPSDDEQPNIEETIAVCEDCAGPKDTPATFTYCSSCVAARLGTSPEDVLRTLCDQSMREEER